jgi:hypothetical protein
MQARTKNIFNFKNDFIEILIRNIDQKNLRAVYNLNSQAKYTIDYIVDVIIAISTKSYTRYKLPADLCNYLNQSQYSKYSRTSIKTVVKEQTYNSSGNNSIFNTYVVIGHDIPVNIKQLNVVISDNLNFVSSDVSLEEQNIKAIDRFNGAIDV